MLFIVVGLGSMGKRRIRLLKQVDETITIIGVDSNSERAVQVSSEFHIMVETSIDAAFEKYGSEVKAAFVCTSPLSHRNVITELLKRGVSVFTEINLVSDGYDELLQMKSNKQVLFLSSTFLYRKDIQYIIEKVKNEKVNYIYHTGQYLPDWHPWESYKNFFVNDKRTNGCREIMAIEMPWIIKCFGKVVNYTIFRDKLSSMDLDYNDNYMILLEHENGSKGMLAVDVVSRKARRNLEIFNENMHVFWNGTPDSLYDYNIEEKYDQLIKTYTSIDKDKNYCENIIENAYMDEILAFLSAVNCEDESKIQYTIKEDKSILDLLDEMNI